MKTAETKYFASISTDDEPNDYTQFNSQIVGATQFGSALPSIDCGSTAYERVGDLIQPSALKVAIDVRFTAGAPQTYPKDITVVLYYGYCKKYKNWTDVNANSSTLCSQLLDVGGPSILTSLQTQPFAGLQSDSHLPINNRVWKLKKKTIRLFKAPGVVNGSASTGSGVISTPNKTNHTFILDFTSMLPAKLKYEDVAADVPENFAPVWTIGYFYNDGTAPDTGDSGILEYKANRMLYWKDI